MTYCQCTVAIHRHLACCTDECYLRSYESLVNVGVSKFPQCLATLIIAKIQTG